MPLLKKAPPHEEVAFALGKLLSAAGMADNMHGTSVAAVSGTRRPAYHLLGLSLDVLIRDRIDEADTGVARRTDRGRSAANAPRLRAGLVSLTH